MIEIRHAAERGITQLDWLDSRHSFSFGEYSDPEHMGFGCLRVINEDIIEPGEGFRTHAHRDMEIITYVLEGALEHKDSLGNGSVIRPGEVQRMSAGTGIRHSEFNASEEERTHLLQIWILPEAEGLEPGYEQKSFTRPDTGEPKLIGSRSGGEAAVTIHQDVDLYVVSLREGAVVEHALRAGRKAWVQVVDGMGDVNGHDLEEGDGAGFSGEERVIMEARRGLELLLFDMA